jgi:hypothetical protein
MNQGTRWILFLKKQPARGNGKKSRASVPFRWQPAKLEVQKTVRMVAEGVCKTGSEECGRKHCFPY